MKKLEGIDEETQVIKPYKRKRKGGRRKSVEVSGYIRRRPR